MRINIIAFIITVIIAIILAGLAVYRYKMKKPITLQCPACTQKACPSTEPIIVRYAKSLDEVLGKRWYCTVNGVVTFAHYQFDKGEGIAATLKLGGSSPNKEIPGVLAVSPTEILFTPTFAGDAAPHRLYVNASGNVQMECEYDGQIYETTKKFVPIAGRKLELAIVRECKLL